MPDRRVFPDGKVQFMHPKDGVYPEKVNAGRTAVNFNSRRIGQNIQPPQVSSAGEHSSGTGVGGWSRSPPRSLSDQGLHELACFI